MRNTRNALIMLLVLVCLAVAAFAASAHAQDRPLFRPGTAPAPSFGAATAASDLAETNQEGAGRGTLAGAASRTFASELLPTGLALGATLLVIVLVRSGLKRFGGGLPGSLRGARRPQGVVEVLARYPIARGQQVVLLKVGRRVIVANQTPQGMSSLSEFTAEAEVADLLARCEAGARAASPFSFDALLRQSGKAMDAEGTRAARQKIDPRDSMPAIMRDADIEMVDLTRPRKGDRTSGGSR